MSTELRIPVQASPVYRAATSGGAYGDTNGVDASFDWRSLLSTAMQVGGPILSTLAGAL